jgi:pimeloyl-ACP methyl ester carboxylesterase
MQSSQNQVTLGNLSLAYREWGAGEAIILLHGLADHGLVWQALAETLSEQFHCFAPDLRGHGNSDKPPASNYGSEAIAQDLEAFATACNLPAVNVVAHSWAAKIALIWARQHPHRLKRLILLDPFFVNRLPGLFRPTFPILYRTLPFLKVMGPFADYATAEATARPLKQYRGWSPLQQAVFQEAMEPKADGRWGSKFAIAARDGVFADILQQPGLTEPLPVPTLLLLPEAGLNRMAWQIQPYRTYLPHLSIQSIAGNHWAHLVSPETCNPAIATFLTNASTPAKPQKAE